jgi:hemerythrin
MIQWQSSLSTGDERTDSQHQYLIDKFNELDEVIQSKDLTEIRLKSGEILDFLQFYASWHFSEEEKLMDALHCPLAEANKKAHAEFLQKFGDFYSKWQTSSMDLLLAQVTYHTLADWIVNHIATIDVHLKEYLPPAEN